jgi:hypothetical protein
MRNPAAIQRLQRPNLTDLLRQFPIHHQQIGRVILDLERSAVERLAGYRKVPGMVVHFNTSISDFHAWYIFRQRASCPEFQALATWGYLAIGIRKPLDYAAPPRLHVAAYVKNVIKVDTNESITLNKQKR